MTNFWLMMRRDLSFLLPPATDNRERRKYVRVMQSNKSTMKEIGVPRFSSSNDYIQFTLPMLDWSGLIFKMTFVKSQVKLHIKGENGGSSPTTTNEKNKLFKFRKQVSNLHAKVL